MIGYANSHIPAQFPMPLPRCYLVLLRDVRGAG
jgi:hypothetical protein